MVITSITIQTFSMESGDVSAWSRGVAWKQQTDLRSVDGSTGIGGTKRLNRIDAGNEKITTITVRSEGYTSVTRRY